MTDPSQYLPPLSTDPAGSRTASASAAIASSSEPAYEPFDARKRDRVETLARQEEDLLAEIAALKRNVPARAAADVAARMAAGVAADEAALTERVAVASAAAAAAAPPKVEAEDDGERRPKLRAAGDASMLGGPPMERGAEVEEAYAAAVAVLERLKRDMPAAVARLERARVAGEYVLTDR